MPAWGLGVRDLGVALPIVPVGFLTARSSSEPTPNELLEVHTDELLFLTQPSLLPFE